MSFAINSIQMSIIFVLSWKQVFRPCLSIPSYTLQMLLWFVGVFMFICYFWEFIGMKYMIKVFHS